MNPYARFNIESRHGVLDAYELEQLIGNLSLEANHNKKRSIQEFACEMAEKFESYEFQLKRVSA